MATKATYSLFVIVIAPAAVGSIAAAATPAGATATVAPFRHLAVLPRLCHCQLVLRR